MISVSWFVDAKTIASIRYAGEVLYESAQASKDKTREIQFTGATGVIAHKSIDIGPSELVISRAIAVAIQSLIRKLDAK